MTQGFYIIDNSTSHIFAYCNLKKTVYSGFFDRFILIFISKGKILHRKINHEKKSARNIEIFVILSFFTAKLVELFLEHAHGK
jgi:hypothetical protein